MAFISKKFGSNKERIRKALARLKDEDENKIKTSLNRYSMRVHALPDKEFQVLAPSIRSAVNFLRYKTHHYTGIEVISINGEDNPFTTPQLLLYDMEKKLRENVMQEIKISRWADGSDKTSTL